MQNVHNTLVTPYTGVWIEILLCSHPAVYWRVTPYTGVWIEIDVIPRLSAKSPVTPYTGVWIEISFVWPHYLLQARHSLYGSVD